MVESVESLSTTIVEKILRSQLWISLDKLLATFSKRKQVRNKQGLMHNSERLSTNLADLSTFSGFLIKKLAREVVSCSYDEDESAVPLLEE